MIRHRHHLRPLRPLDVTPGHGVPAGDMAHHLGHQPLLPDLGGDARKGASEAVESAIGESVHFTEAAEPFGNHAVTVGGLDGFAGACGEQQADAWRQGRDRLRVQTFAERGNTEGKP